MVAEASYSQKSGFFCWAHERSFTPEAYVNSHGKFLYGKDWGWPLRATARNAYWINVLMPCDVTAFFKVSDQIITADLDVLDGHQLVHLWAAGYMKWPVAIEQWMANEVPGVSAGAHLAGLAGRALPEYVNQSVAVARRIDRLSLGWMHESISTKRMACTMGAQMWLQRLGVITKEPAQPAKKLRINTKGGPSPGLLLGKQSERFRISSEPAAVWQKIVDIADSTPPIKVPRTAEEMIVFIRELSIWLARFPACMNHSSDFSNPSLIEDSSLAYIRRHVLRKIVLAVCRPLPSNEAFHSLTLKDLSLAICDRGGQASCLPATSTWGDLEHMFAMHPLMISCWTCLLADLTDAERIPFDAMQGMKLKKTAEELAEGHEGTSPSLRRLALHISEAA